MDTPKFEVGELVYFDRPGSWVDGCWGEILRLYAFRAGGGTSHVDIQFNGYTTTLPKYQVVKVALEGSQWPIPSAAYMKVPTCIRRKAARRQELKKGSHR